MNGKNDKPLIGFIGQGFIGRNYADDFEERGYEVVRYARGEEFAANRERLKECEMVFIAVPTPTTPEGFDSSVVESVLPLVGRGKTAVIKSTMQPGSTEKLAEKFPDIFLMHSPEFLREKTARRDAANPDRNIVGIVSDTPEYRARAEAVLAVLPPAPVARVVGVREAELIKYIGNCFLMTKVVFFNVMYDLAAAQNLDWEEIRSLVAADPRIGPSHTRIFHESGHGGPKARGAGGHCFIKDFAAIAELYEDLLPEDRRGRAVLAAIEEKNAELLRKSGKDIDLLDDVHGPDFGNDA